MIDAALLRALGTATLGEVCPAARILDAGLHPLAPGMTLAGPALTVQCQPGDNLALHLAIARLLPGEVLVVDYGGSLGSGPFGEIMALACLQRGAAGMVIDGAVRDSQRIVGLGFQVFCRGLAIPGTTKQDRGVIGGTVLVGGVEIAQGEIVVADADAVLCLPPGQASDALAAGQARERKEEAMMQRIRMGETTLTILGLEG